MPLAIVLELGRDEARPPNDPVGPSFGFTAWRLQILAPGFSPDLYSQVHISSEAALPRKRLETMANLGH